MGTRVKNRIKMDNQILKGAAVVVLFPPKEDEITGKDFSSGNGSYNKDN